MNQELFEWMRKRHSVRQYKKIPIKEEIKTLICSYLEELNKESGLDIRLVENTKNVFSGLLLKFAGWKNPAPAYFAFIGKKSSDLAKKCGYYGEKLVLYVQSLGLNTCWVGLFNKTGVKEQIDESVIITIALGYGKTEGTVRKRKSLSQVCKYEGQMPEWFKNGVTCALLAPTAIHRQAFMIAGKGNQVQLTYSKGAYSNVDYGIIKYHFEQGAGKENFEWILEE